MHLLIEGARTLGFSLTARQIEQFQLYYDTLVEWNAKVNLTAITEYEAVQVRHFLDSLTVGSALLKETQVAWDEPASSPWVPAHGFRIADIGTGAGFPGVPLKILWPHIHLMLSDSIGKKTTFLKELVSILELTDVEIRTARAEELGQDRKHRQQYDAVTARAVASLPVLCEYCLPLAKPGGIMLAPKKGDIRQELQEAEAASRILGGDVPRLHPFTIHGEDEERYVVAIRKLRPTHPGFPRRVGLAKSQPLGSKDKG
jgi:16S rRNA (guanine527-N7)-methyltransferase